MYSDITFTSSARCFVFHTLALLFALLPSTVAAQEAVDFAHDILPVLTSKCAKCHSNGAYQGDLSLETRDALLEAGVVEMGVAAESELYLRITSDEPDYRMPPEGPRWNPDQIKNFARWINDGLDWPAQLTLKAIAFQRPLGLRMPVGNDGAANEVHGVHPVDNLIDGYFLANSVPSPPPLSDREFLRRAKLDLLGLLPTPTETETFVARSDPAKRTELIDDFLARNRDYADHWISFWNDLLRNDYAGTGYIDGGRKQITGWLHRSLTENTPYDQFVRELIHPSSESDGFIKGIKWRGRVNASQIEPLQFSQNLSQVFLGINMKCASCHDSFIDDWKLADAYGLAAITAEKPLEIHRCDVPTGNVATSKFVFPAIGDIDQTLPREERLARLAELTTSKDNGRFARTIVNRLWHRLMGRGLVHPIDEMANESWSEPLLDLLATELIRHEYDLKYLLRLMTTSQVYQSQSVSVAEPVGDWDASFVFQGVIAKRMTAEQFVDAIWQLTGASPEKMKAKIRKTTGPLHVVRASLVTSDALMRSLGRPNREQVVSTRPGGLSTLQALDLSNGEILAGWLSQGAKNWMARQVDLEWTSKELVAQLFAEALTRKPTDEELTLLLSGDEQDSQQAIEDLMWVVVMLPEFQFVR